ncbi:ABC transporter ATP-binding protein [Cetobacterium sp. SF1]|uniref:ABC transporter ATP-binding protein n=1 Tax=unclassified Cetobacterium TaxID=2630983 RepID=UPI003CE6E004
MTKNKILEMKNISKRFKNKIALENINLDLYEGETLGIVGPSGGGKSTLGKILLMLLEADTGEIIYKNENILKAGKSKQLQLRKDIQMVLQDPYLSLNPRKTIGWHLEEPLRVLNYPKEERKEKILTMMKMVGLSKDYYDKYPKELSGGQRQRVLILASILMEPKIIVLDESVSALDISVQAQILNLLIDLQKELKLTYVFISHDLSVVKYICDRIAFIKNGTLDRVIENSEFEY